MKLIDKDAVVSWVAEKREAALYRQHNLERIGQETYVNQMIADNLGRMLSFLDTLEVKEVKDSGLYEEQSVCLDAITSWSISENFGIMAEECGEMLSAINKLLRGRANPEDVITELADVSLVITAFATYLGYDKYLSEKARKLQRLKKRLEDWHEKVLLNRNTNQQ